MSEQIFTDQNFENEVIKSDVPVLVDFWAPWCGPCQQMGPIIEELAKNYEGKAVKIGKMDVDENSETAGKYGIMSIPTLILFHQGEVKDQMTGVQSLDDLTKKINEVIE